MRKIKIKELKQLHNKGAHISFDMCMHLRIPSYVLVSEKILGYVTKSTYKAFIKYISINVL